VHFYGSGGKFLLNPTAPAYTLLGDISCLAHFYELRRHLPAQVPVVSVIHARHADDCFADIDGSWPLHLVVANTLSAEQYLTAIQEQFGTQLTPGAGILGRAAGDVRSRSSPVSVEAQLARRFIKN
jgi:hypothetical protein